MNRRNFLKQGPLAAGIGIAAAQSSPQPATAKQSRPNILIIMSDQLSWKALPLYGNKDISTPNIDRIAKRATAFSQCYTTCPLCMPARPALWTGRLPHETGVTTNGGKFAEEPIPIHMPTLGSLFKETGYETAHFGKTHDSGSLRGFDHIEEENESDVDFHPAWPVNYDTKRDRYTTPKVVDFLTRDHSQPYLAVADLNNPHNICGWVGHNEGVHTDTPIPTDLPPLPDNFRDVNFDKRPLPVQYICCSHNRLSQAAEWNETNYRHYLAAYYHYIGRLDDEIGLILDALESHPDRDNTIVVFLADHGDGMAAHGMVTKQVSFIEETNRVPFMIAGPGFRKDQLLETPLISHLDLLPTLCDCAGISSPDDLRGSSLVPWLRGNRDDSPHDFIAGEWQTEWSYTISPGRMIRTARYKYTRFIEGDGEELYDLAIDPGETKTLIDEPEYRNVLEEHRRLLAGHVKDTGDPFFGLSYKADKRWRSHETGYHNHRGLSAPQTLQK